MHTNDIGICVSLLQGTNKMTLYRYEESRVLLAENEQGEHTLM